MLQGTLDLMVLRTLETMGPQHGLRLGQAHPAGIRRRARPQSGHGLSGAPAARAARLDQGAMGRLQQQSQGEVLRAHPTRTSQIRARDRELGADRLRDGAVPRAPGAGAVMFDRWLNVVPCASARPRARGPASSSSAKRSSGLSPAWRVDRRRAAGGQARCGGNRPGERGVSRRARPASRRNNVAQRAVRGALAPSEPGRHGGGCRHARRRDRCNVRHLRRRQRRPAEAVAVSGRRFSRCDRAPGARERRRHSVGALLVPRLS